MNNAELIIFTNGCFDILHRGHFELLEFCKSLGTVTVGINSDESVRLLKGPNRPINPLEDRIQALQSIKYVDRVVVFEEKTPLELIKKIRPNIIVKGGDYKDDQVIGREFAEVIIFPYVKGKSSSSLIDKMKLF